MMQFKKFRYGKISALAALAIASATLTSTGALAAVVCGPSAVPVPADIDGVYFNIVTFTGGTAGGSVPGWDINLYLTGGALYFFWPSAPASSFGGLATGTVYQALSAGAVIDGTGTYSVASGGGGAANFVNWQTTNTGKFLGVRFFNESTSAINYGWLQLDTGASGGFPATINSYCYDDTGAGITAGTTPVSLQSYSVD